MQTAEQNTGKYILTGLLLFLLWFLLHVFTIGWETPNTVSPETDGIPPVPGMTAQQMMAYETYKYPPLQYLTVHLFAPERGRGGGGDILQLSTARILVFRLISAIQESGIMILLFLFCSAGLKLSLLSSAGACILLLFSPGFLYYSQTTNMDMPGAFWFMAAVCCIFFTEKYRGTLRRKFQWGCDLFSGILIGCAFCTKDQIYALMILPALFLWIRRCREERSPGKALLPFLFWGAGFLVSTGLIYLGIGGKEVFLSHFRWITGEGSHASYAMTGRNFTGCLMLFLRQMQDLILAFGFAPVLFCVLMMDRKLRTSRNGEKLLFSFLGIAFLSQFFFFTLIVRYTYPRYLLGLIPFACAGTIWLGSQLSAAKKRWLFAALFLFAGASAVICLDEVRNTPRAVIRKKAEILKQEGFRIFTAESRFGERYFRQADGRIISRRTVRSWAKPMGLSVRDMVWDDLSFFVFDPDYVITETGGEKEKYPLLDGMESFAPGMILEKLCSVKTVYLFKNTRRTPVGLDRFRRHSAEDQLLLLADVFAKRPPLTVGKAAEIGKALAPFREPDMAKYDIQKGACQLAAGFYQVAGRKEDAAKMLDFIRRSF